MLSLLDWIQIQKSISMPPGVVDKIVVLHSFAGHGGLMVERFLSTEVI